MYTWIHMKHMAYKEAEMFIQLQGSLGWVLLALPPNSSATQAPDQPPCHQVSKAQTTNLVRSQRSNRSGWNTLCISGKICPTCLSPVCTRHAWWLLEPRQNTYTSWHWFPIPVHQRIWIKLALKLLPYNRLNWWNSIQTVFKQSKSNCYLLYHLAITTD